MFGDAGQGKQLVWQLVDGTQAFHLGEDKQVMSPGTMQDLYLA